MPSGRDNSNPAQGAQRAFAESEASSDTDNEDDDLDIIESSRKGLGISRYIDLLTQTQSQPKDVEVQRSIDHVDDDITDDEIDTPKQPEEPSEDDDDVVESEWSDEDTRAAYKNWKERKTLKRKRVAAETNRIRAEKKSKVAAAASIVGRKPRSKNRHDQGLSGFSTDTVVEDKDPVPAYLDDPIPDYFLSRQESLKKLHEAGLRYPPSYEDVDFSDSETQEKPRLDKAINPQRARKDIKLRESHGVIPAPIAQWLRDYQVEGVQFLHEKFVKQTGAILGDDMGLGKTIQVIAFLTAAFGKTGTERDAKCMRKIRRFGNSRWYPRVLIVCPGTLMQNWEDELSKWGWWEVYRYHGSSVADRKGVLGAAAKGMLEIMITTYTTYRSHESEINTVDWDCVIADECHQIKSKNAEITKAMNKINALCRIGLTGTAIQNKYEEIWNLLNWARPGAYGSAQAWKQNISLPLKLGQAHDATHAQLADSRSRAQDLVHKILPSVFLRRMKTLIADQLPKKSDRVIFCQLTETQADAYRTFLESDRCEFIRTARQECDCGSERTRGYCCYTELPEEGEKWSNFIFPCMVTFQKLANHLALIVPMSTENPEKQAKDLQTLELACPKTFKTLFQIRDNILVQSQREFCGKWKVLRRLLDFWHANGDKVLIFSHSVRLLRLLRGLFDVDGTKYNFSYLDGSMKYEDRSQAIYKQQQANIGYNASEERRYFKGVMDQSGKKGELFGLENLFTFQENSVLLREIMHKTNVAESKAGVNAYDFHVDETQFDSEDEDILSNKSLGIEDDANIAGIKKFADSFLSKTGTSNKGKKATKRGDTDPVNAILAKAGVQYTHENSEVIGRSEVEVRLGKQAMELRNDVNLATKRVFQGSQSQSQSQHQLRLQGIEEEFSAEEDDDLHITGSATKGEFKINYRYRPDEHIRKRQLCSMAENMGFDDPVEFALLVESSTQAERRTMLERALLIATLHHYILHPLFFHPLSRIPGTKLYALTKWRLAWDDWTGQWTRIIHALHLTYGPAVRIGPNEVHFNSLSALRTVYGTGSGFERTSFYAMFSVYGKGNMFTFSSGAEHAKRKRLLSRSYSKSGLSTHHHAEAIVLKKIKDFLELVSNTGKGKESLEIFAALHYYAIDVITTFLYGTQDFGATTALRGNTDHLALLNDIIDPTRRRLSWFAVHLPSFTAWLYTRTGVMGHIVQPILPMAKPATYTGIRMHALRAMRAYRYADQVSRAKAQKSVIAELCKATHKQDIPMDDLDIASECADHLLAGIDTTSDTLMFLIWSLSLPHNAHVQQRLIDECQSIPEQDLSGTLVDLKTADRMPYLNAVIKETLRLYAPLPASEPRSSPVDTVIDGYSIPRRTVCSMAPYSLHRNENVFPEPLKWKPERWISGGKDKTAEMERWFWAFSSGARMCIGLHLAMAEMALVPSLYRKYGSRIRPGSERIAPGITSRFEVFTDETYPEMKRNPTMTDAVPGTYLLDPICPSRMPRGPLTQRKLSTFTTLFLAATAMSTAIRMPNTAGSRYPRMSSRSTEMDSAPYRDASLPVDERVEDLLQRMNLEEKAGQLFHQIINQGDNGTLANGTDLSVSGKFMTHFNLHGPISDVRQTVQWYNSLQQMALDTRLGIPVTISSDPRHAFTDAVGSQIAATKFSQWPSTLGLAAVRDADLVHTFANIARQEYNAVGIKSALHPQIDVATEPRWARIGTTMGENATLTAELAVAYINGFTGPNGFGNDSVTTVSKHFPGSGPVQGGEDSHFVYGKNTTYPGHNLEHHLIPFRAAIKAGTRQIMPYYSRPTGTKYEEVAAGMNKGIVTDLLRGELGFEGIVCSDWGLITDGVISGQDMPARAWGAENLTEIQRAEKILNAGTDQMGGEERTDLILQLVGNGTVSEDRIDRSVRRLLREKFLLGLFDAPFLDADAAEASVGRDEWIAAGYEAQRRSFTLLTNTDAALPLSASECTQRQAKFYIEGLNATYLHSRNLSVVPTPQEADYALLRLQAPYEPRPGGFEASYHAGSLEYNATEKARQSAIYKAVPTFVDIYLDRPGAFPEIVVQVKALMVNFGASPDAFLDTVFGVGGKGPEGRLPFDLPRSDEAARMQKEDVPFDTVDPVFRFGHGLRYEGC
ncbi:glycosyl hydrolase family 3 N terminal domain-containing [Pyrenophora seminiperda CCB06]|uniref:Glycosyl hydrolase family 3 N terminal domain-containing n=1 Tax=Pyrenophora seminiperda CCB06 TaxID=1302712 RepID=A0A3M7MFB2_9PLEO|nr:glycosyl hydrolase family 3 N terminal domain-containing [Pyrenophora seminiperda CCB06]